MSSPFLASGGSSIQAVLTSGTQPVNFSTITSQSLVPNLPVCASISKELVSRQLQPADLGFSVLTNPFIGTITTDGLISDQITIVQQASMGAPIAGRDILWSLTTDGRLYTTNPAGTANKITYDADISSLPYLPLSGGTLSGFLNSQSILPTTTNLYSLGSTSFRFARLWTNEVESGTGSFITLGTNLLTSVAPTQTLTASTAINLNTPTLLKSGVAIATAIDLAGKVSRDGTLAMTGNFDVGGFKIVNVGTPTIGTDGVNKTYADLFVPKTGAVVITGGLDTSDLAPRADGTYALGLPFFRYSNLHMGGSLINTAANNNLSMATLNQINITTTALNTSGSFNAVSYKLNGLGATIARSGDAFVGASNMVCGATSAPTLTGTGNIVYGIGSLTNATGISNMCFGNSIMTNATVSTAGSSVAIGNSSLQNLQTGNNNIALGGGAGINLASGSANMLIGSFCGFNLTTGDNNTAVGASSGPNGNFTGTICLGRQCLSNASNQFVFGSSTAPINRMIYGDTTNFCDIGSATVAFKDIYTNSTIRNSDGSNVITMTTPNMTLATTGNFAITAIGASTLNGLAITTNDSATAGFIRRSGDTMSGRLAMTENGTTPSIYNAAATTTGIAFLGTSVYMVSNGNTNWIVKPGSIDISAIPITPVVNNTTDLGVVGGANSFRTAYVHTSINSGNGNFVLATGGATGNASLTATGTIGVNPSGVLTLGGTSATITNNLVSATLPHAIMYSTTDTTNYPIVFTLANPTQLITFTSNGPAFATPGFTVGATGILTYTATRTRRVRFTFTSSYSPATNTSSTIRHWFSKNGSTALPTTTTAVVSHTTADADTNVPHSETLNDVIEMATGNTLQLIANYPVGVNTTVNYRNVCFIAQALLD